jgi:hypothetical protein
MPDDVRWDEAESVDVAAELPSKLQPFAESELIACEACGRTNGPNRPTCIYCGANLVTNVVAPAVAAATQPDTALAECGVILAINDASQLTTQIDRLSSLIDVEATLLRLCFEAGGPLPLLRPANAGEAEQISAELQAEGLQIVRISDEQLSNTFRKIRGLEFGDDWIAPFPRSETDRPILFTDVHLLVAGRIITNRVEVEEKRQRKGTQAVDTRQFIADESVMDIYTLTNPTPWRIYSNAFDFSCLGPDKRLTGFENFGVLINLIRGRLPNVVIDDSYFRKRAVLGNIWPVETADKSELRLAGRGKLNVSNITTSDNEAQFTKYSALAWHLRTRAEVADQ